MVANLYLARDIRPYSNEADSAYLYNGYKESLRRAIKYTETKEASYCNLFAEQLLTMIQVFPQDAFLLNLLMQIQDDLTVPKIKAGVDNQIRLFDSQRPAIYNIPMSHVYNSDSSSLIPATTSARTVVAAEISHESISIEPNGQDTATTTVSDTINPTLRPRVKLAAPPAKKKPEYTDTVPKRHEASNYDFFGAAGPTSFTNTLEQTQQDRGEATIKSLLDELDRLATPNTATTAVLNEDPATAPVNLGI